MGEMSQTWTIKDIENSINKQTEIYMKKFEDRIYSICLDTAKRAKDEHDYNNYSGELESSVGFVILKDLQEVRQWSLMASSGTSPMEGLQDIRNLVYDEIVGKSKLPDGTILPKKGLVGVVFAAAPYAAEVEGNNRKVLIDFAPSSSYVLTILKTVI